MTIDVYMFTLLVFIAVLATLVISHEFGHFFVARKNGIRVEEFGFGFPPRICGVRRITENGKKRWQWVWGHPKTEGQSELPTLYSFNIIPLGGFVKIKGENAQDDSANDPDSFVTKKTWQKAAVLVAGVGMNILVAFLLLSGGYMIGLPEAVGDNPAELQNVSLQIVDVLPGKPAATAGIMPGDAIVQVGTIVNPSLTQFQEYVHSHKEVVIDVQVKHDGQIIAKQIKPELMTETGQAGIGVGLAAIGIAKYPWYKALYYGMLSTSFYLKAIIISFYDLITGLFTGKGVGEAVSGPVGVAVMTGQVARLGIIYLMQFTALLSLNLAVLNILPIPALDGGRLFFILLKKIIRKPITPRVEQTIHLVGFVFLMILVITVTIKDIGTFGGSIVQWFKHLI